MWLIYSLGNIIDLVDIIANEDRVYKTDGQMFLNFYEFIFLSIVSWEN
jgi:hypothetical protein